MQEIEDRGIAIMRAALYARYSSDWQRAASNEDQFRDCSEHEAREGWKLAGACSASVVSGDSMNLHPDVSFWRTRDEKCSRS